MDAVYQQLLSILNRHLSPLNAESVLRSALRRHGLQRDKLAAREVSLIAPDLERGLCLFGNPQHRAALHHELQSLSSSPRRLEPCTIQVKSEQDIVSARGVARRMCEELGARSFTVQRVATVVGELARNIVSYTRGGVIELTPAPDRAFVVQARDDGPGIPNLDEILSGRYRSKTGLGLGLLGTKRLSDNFHIETGARGTSVEVRISL